MNIESRMTPVKNFLDKVFIDQLFTEKKREDFKCAPQDLGYGGDISVSIQYDTPYDMHCALIT